MQWWIQNHVLNTWWYSGTIKNIHITTSSVMLSFHYLMYMGDGFSDICIHHIYTAILSQPGKRSIFNNSAFTKWLSARVREGKMLKLKSEWITVMVAVVKGGQPMQWPIRVSLCVGCMDPIFTTSPLVLKMFNIVEAITSSVPAPTPITLKCL